MLAAQNQHLQVADAVHAGVLILGGLCALGFMVWLLRRGRWRRPLAGVEGTGAGPGIADVGLVLLLYVGVGLTLLMMLVGVEEGDQRRTPGSHAWHVAQNADAVAKLLSVAVMLWILSRRRSFPPALGRRASVLRIAGAGVLGALIVTSLCTVQLNMVAILWQWLEPDRVLPVHPVLEALEQTEWGPWAPWQLLVTVVVVAPLAEELFFRGLVLQMLWRYTRHAWLAVCLSGLAFGAIHGQPQDILPLATRGVVLGYLRLRTRSLGACIIAHALFNARTMVLAIFFPELVSEG